MGRNTPILQEITEALYANLDEQASALTRLENHFRDRLLVDVGDVHTVGTYTKQLRLRITEDERSVVLGRFTIHRRLTASRAASTLPRNMAASLS